VSEVLPLLYLHGMSTGDFAPALAEFFGSAAGLSASVITRLTSQWQDEHRAFMRRDLSDRDFVYVWVDGVHFNVRLEADRLCCLVIVGVRLDGSKELVAIADGYRESADSWGDLLRDLKRRGMRAPMIAVGDGALGFWAALRDVWPETREQRDWVHKVANVLDALPKSVQPTAKKMLVEIRDAEDRDHAVEAAKQFDAEFRSKWPKAADKISGDLERLLTFYDFPAEHWLHLKTSNPIESTFSTVRLRTKVTKGPGSRAAGLAMAFKLIESAQTRWRAVNGPHLVAVVRAGAVFRKGVLIENNPAEDQVAA
jgi:transposase-like protein